MELLIFYSKPEQNRGITSPLERGQTLLVSSECLTRFEVDAFSRKLALAS